jgi:hypothetical protein
MCHFRMRFLLFSMSVLAWSCAAPYKSLKPVTAESACIDKMRPQTLRTSWFTASVDIVGRHLSGLLFIKEMPDQSKRVVFTSETGITFFDFEFQGDDFQVKQIIPQLRKKIITNTLRKDFETLLALPFQNKTMQAWTMGDERYFGTSTRGKEKAFFVTDKSCTTLKRMEVGFKKPLFSIVTAGIDAAAPESVVITHHTFNMVINLKKMDRHVAE